MSNPIGRNAGTIVVKKIVKGDHGHHGGAWKVTYADFVTAMMAFFLLLWLLNATTDEQKRGISEYFTPASVSLSTGGAGGMLGGQALAPGASVSATSSAPVIVEIAAPPPPVITETVEKDPDEDALEKFKAEQEQSAFEDAQNELQIALQNDPEMAGLQDNLVVDMTPERMRIQIVDKEGGGMFSSGSATLQPRTRKLFEKVAQAIGRLPNRLSISGHTDSSPLNKPNYSNWELSSDRANASRRALAAAGLEADRFARVTGKADIEPIDLEDPFKPENRRISIVLLRQAPVLSPELQKKKK